MKTRWLFVLCCLSALVVMLVQWRDISRLRQQVNELRGEQERPSTEATAVATASDPRDAELEQLRKDKAELLQLRDELRRFREQMAASRAARTAATETPVSPSNPQQAEAIRSLAMAAGAGDYTALEKLDALLRAPRDRARAEVLAEVRTAFDALGAEAAKGNTTALEALIRASRMTGLQGVAIKALGQAAGQGNEQALEPLLDPERYFLRKSSVVIALQPAADSGNIRAIQALANVAADQTARGLWLVTAQGLQGAAKAGNATAIDALALLVRSENQEARRTAFAALESAAVQHPRAADVLRRLSEK